jgi:hypothetical protein
MRCKSGLVLFAILGLLPLQMGLGQNRAAGRLAILPFRAVGIDQATAESAEELLRMEIVRSESLAVIPARTVQNALADTFCFEIPCAVAAGKAMGADQVLLTSLLALGGKVVVQYQLVDVANEKPILIDRSTAAFAEDLDTVMERVARSIILQVPISRTAEVGAITAQEAQKPLRRGSRSYASLAFGYLYPRNGYDEVESSFCMEFRSGAEFNRYEMGMLMALHKGFAMNVYGHLLGTRKDLCPYFGGGLGFHWVHHSENYYIASPDYENGYNWDDKKKDGIEVSANAGLKIMRTYSTQILLNLSYTYCFNEYDDSAVVFTLGLLR